MKRDIDLSRRDERESFVRQPRAAEERNDRQKH